MQIRKIFSKFLICILCLVCLHGTSFAVGNVPSGEIGDFGNWLTEDNLRTVSDNMSGNFTSFQSNFQTNVNSEGFVPLEVKIGLTFMRALSSIDSVLQNSLVRFTVIFLFIMYAFWVALEAYKLIRDSGDYKKALYDIFTKGILIAAWVMILNYGPAKIFNMIITPIINMGTYISDFILDAVAKTYNATIPDTCSAIHDYVNTNSTSEMLIDKESAANIMCLPARISVFFYKATAVALSWIAVGGFGHSATAVVVGAICTVIFIKCIFKYAFMTLGVVADLFLTLLLLPFTALAESMPTTSEKNYVGQIFNGLLKIFNTKKLSDVISVFINTAVYFVSLSIVISICAALLTHIISVSPNNVYSINSAMPTVLCGCLALYLAGKSDEYAKKIGGSIDNSFGEQLKNDTKTIWNNTKSFAGKLVKAWAKSK